MDIFTSVFDLCAHLGLTYTNANKIATAVNAGMSLASVIGVVSGVGSLVSMFWFAIKKVAATSSKKVLIAW